MPYFSANKPVPNGRNAEPATPTPVIHPTHAVNIGDGRIREPCEIKIGNKGPIQMPMKDTYKNKINEMKQTGVRTNRNSVLKNGRYDPNSDLGSVNSGFLFSVDAISKR